MTQHWQVIEAALEGKRSLEHILSDERDGGAHQRNIAAIDAALAFVREMRQGQWMRIVDAGVGKSIMVGFDKLDDAPSPGQAAKEMDGIAGK